MGDKRYRVGGTRGGQDQFKWDDVKSDIHRENYLGHSLLAPVGRWQRGKDLKWWNKKGEQADSARAQAEMEKARLKQLDEDLLNEALGLAPRKVRTQQSELSAADKKQLLEKGATMDRDGADTERVSGLGAGPAKLHDHIPALTLKERELERLKRERERKEGGLTEASLVEIVDYEKEQQDLAAAAGAEASRDRLREEKRSKKREKREKKRARKEKKEKKREKKKLKKAKDIGRAPPAEFYNDELRAGSVGRQGGHLEGRSDGGNWGNPGHGSSNRCVREQRSFEHSGRGVSSRGREASEEGGYRRGGDNGSTRDGESKGRADWNRRGAGERERLPAPRPRSRSPPTSRERANDRRENSRGRWDSRDRRARGDRSASRVKDSGATRARDRRDWGGEKRARRSRSASSSSSSSSSGGSSGGSSSGGGHSAASRSRDNRGNHRHDVASHGFASSRFRADGGGGARFNGDRSRSPGRRMESGSDRRTGRHDIRGRGDGNQGAANGRNWRR